MATPAVEDSSKRPERELIDCSNYDASRFEATLDEAARHWPSFKGVPASWDINDALRHLLTPEQFEPIKCELAEMRDAGYDGASRVALLVFRILHLEGTAWSQPCRYAAAYGALRIGLGDHHYEIMANCPAGILLLVDAEEAFFRYGNTLSDLTHLLLECARPQEGTPH